MFKYSAFLFLCLFAFAGFAQGQKTAIVYGSVTDSTGREISDVNIVLIGTNTLTLSKQDGSYTITVPAEKEIEIGFSFIGSQSLKMKVPVLEPGQKYKLDVKMTFGLSLRPFVYTEERDRDKASTQILNVRQIKSLPNVSGSFEQILKTLPGVASNNELSSQYNVRGGNYDENLIYVNDIEIYRPFLPRSGQQEGLSFIHTEMVENVRFSAGGFEARYGDKMSSVLDIKYKQPKKFAASFNASLLGVQSHVEGASKNLRFTYLLGARYWTNQYVLSTLDVQGDYKPSFADVQTLLTYHFRENLSLSVLGSYAQNKFLVIPQTRETTFGTVKQALQLRMFFDGQDLMEYRTATGAMSLNYMPTQKTQLKLISSVFHSNENELYTIEGAYRLEEIETDFGNANFGQAKASKGIGYFLNNARNRIDALVFNVGHRGYHTVGNNSIQWGAQYQTERIHDKLNEWNYSDSLGFAQPSIVNGEVVVKDYLSTNLSLYSYRLSGYVQNSQRLNKDYNVQLTYGLRTNWWSYNNENVVSPRVQLSFEPNKKHNRAVVSESKDGVLRKDIKIKAAFGYYYQPPFYRELRGFDGVLNPNIKAQKAIHYVLGGDVNFKAFGGRPFKFFAEAYYKHLDNLIPYEIDNVRIRYYAENSAIGYATGIDMRVNGEFVKGMESWASLSVMKTQEKIPGAIVTDGNGNRVTPGYIPRQTDQRVTFSMFFQDYLPNNPKFKMSLNFVYGTGLPFGPPDRNRYGDTLRIPSYFRVDMGFSRVLIDENEKDRRGIKKYVRSAWAGIDVFNILAINNTISYIWIEDVEARTWAVPNYLTGRRVNLRLVIYL